MFKHKDRNVIIIGAGPAGLIAAYQLCKAGIPSTVLEKDQTVGGLARTVNYKGYRFDIGGHRFFTKVGVVEAMWHEVLGGDFLRRKRFSRIYYNKRFFFYPLQASNALFGLGLWNSFLILLSYLKPSEGSLYEKSIPSVRKLAHVKNRRGLFTRISSMVPSLMPSSRRRGMNFVSTKSNPGPPP